MDNLKRMKKLVKQLNQAAKAYYQEDREIMSNREYDQLYDELVKLEEKTGVVMAKSPTVTVGYESLEELPKERHESPMLSLNKTKDMGELQSWLNQNHGLLSWKLDGLTIVLTYQEGKLVKAVTRGNGEVGEVITNNAKVFKNLPLTIPYKGELVLRGEAVIQYSDFEAINKELEEAARYKNPRNLCSGTVRQLNNAVTAERNVHFYAFALVSAQEEEFHNSRERQFQWLMEQGFEVVEYRMVTGDNLPEAINWFSEKIQNFDIPSDGLVLILEDIAYGESLGRTAKFPRNAIAFKWADETAQTHLVEIEWSPSRTGLINPVAIFEPVELEGTTVSRASIHNVSMVRELKLGEGDLLEVYKANMIIPQIARNLTESGSCSIPENCPACGGSTRIEENGEVQYLYCMNPECAAKRIKSFTLLTSRDALNIEGLSEATLEKFIDKGFIQEPVDMFHLEQHHESIVSLEGFGERSYKKLMENIEKARQTTMPRFLYGLGIPNIGLVNAKVLCKSYRNNIQSIMKADKEELSDIDGIGPVIGESVVNYFKSEEQSDRAMALLQELDIQEEEEAKEQPFADQIFVITGSTQQFANRSEMKEFIEKLGGRVTGNVSKNTTYLINNDTASSSGKNKKAKELGIEIISEAKMLELAGGL
ncbi:MAG: NAD-dependent DNA ligase LigA [Lachnospiraceae bacterium]|nr:NAD-dependent DNA ligase LigA [Lachnospiraceae bacterium]